VGRTLANIEWVNATPAIANFVKENPAVWLNLLVAGHLDAADSQQQPIQGLLITQFEIKSDGQSAVELDVSWGNFGGCCFRNSYRYAAGLNRFESKLLEALEGLKSSHGGMLKLPFLAPQGI
jgi:hypothetical protein